MQLRGLGGNVGRSWFLRLKLSVTSNGESSGNSHFSNQSRKSPRILHQPSPDKGFIRRPLTTATVYEFFKSAAVNPDRFSAPQRSRLTFQHRHTTLKPAVSAENSQSVSQTCRAAGKKTLICILFLDRRSLCFDAAHEWCPGPAPNSQNPSLHLARVQTETGTRQEGEASNRFRTFIHILDRRKKDNQ